MSRAGWSSSVSTRLGPGVGHEHRVTDRLPAVTHTDPKRRLRSDPGDDDGVAQHITIEELVRRGHPQIITGAAADKRDSGAGNRVRTTHNLLLVSGQAVGQQHQNMKRRRP